MAESILVIDDESGIRKLLRTILEREGYQVAEATDGAAGLQLIKNLPQPPDLILLDVNMPQMSGMEMLKILREQQNHTPVLFVTARSEPKDIIGALNLGANDYITKPFVFGEVLARVKNHLRLHRRDHDLEENNAKLKTLVDVDDLTGLYNMRSIYHKIAEAQQHCLRFRQDLGLVMMDIDHFKQVNDSNDHLFGSFVLSEIGKILRENLERPYFGARYGGDEFLLVYPQITKEELLGKADKIRQQLADHLFKNEHYELRLTSSMGITLWNHQLALPVPPKELVRHADFALYEAKEQGRNRIVFR